MAIDSVGKIYLTNGGFSQGRLYSFNPDLSLRWSEVINNVNIGGPALGENGTLVVCGTGTDVRAYSDFPVSISPRENEINSFLLEQNYPNPFNPITKIEYRIPNSEFVSLKVYDILGNEIATLVNEEKSAGEYEVEFSAKGGSASGGNAYDLPSGIYFYQLKAGGFIETKKMILMK
jgi:hypothetical protein